MCSSHRTERSFGLCNGSIPQIQTAFDRFGEFLVASDGLEYLIPVFVVVSDCGMNSRKRQSRVQIANLVRAQALSLVFRHDMSDFDSSAGYARLSSTDALIHSDMTINS